MKTSPYFLLLIALISFKCTSQSLQPIADDEALVSITKEIQGYLAAGDFDSTTKHFNDQMKTALKPEQLKPVWDGLVSQVGAFQSTGNITSGELEGYRVVYQVLKFEESPFKLKVVFDNEDKVAGLFIIPVNKI